MRIHTCCFSSSFMKTQFDTSMAVRPHPRQISSKSVEHMATQGESVAVKTRSRGAEAGAAGATLAPAAEEPVADAAAGAAEAVDPDRGLRVSGIVMKSG
jgi:hypothetical protein